MAPDHDTEDALYRVKWRLLALELAIGGAGMERPEREALVRIAGDAMDELETVLDHFGARGEAPHES